MKKNILTLYLLITLTTFYNFSCNTTEPPIVDNIPPGKRDYVWSIDSIDYGNLPGLIQIESIWGSSSTDVWGAGYTADVQDCLWHYDGIKWTRATEGTPITATGGGSKIVGKIWGTTENNVWAIGGRISSNPPSRYPFVMRYDGMRWSEIFGDVNNMPTGCTAIFGIREGEFWVSELENVVHYNNGSWQKYFVGENFLVWGITGENENIFAVAYDISSGGNRVIIIRIKNGQLSIIDETTLTDISGNYNGKFEPSKLWVSNGKLCTAWHKISLTNIFDDGAINQSGWHSVLALPDGQFFVNTFYHNQKDIFVLGYPNLLYHFNGSDWQNLVINVNGNIVTTGEYSAVWNNGNEILVCDKENGVIYHGR